MKKYILVIIFGLVSSVAHAQEKERLLDLQKRNTLVFNKVESAPADVLAAIKATPLQSKDSLSGFRIVDSQIIHVDQLTINALSTTKFRVASTPPKYPFYVIAARVINIEVPSVRRDAARIGFLLQPGNLNGPDGLTGGRGRSWPDDWQDQNGEGGGQGQIGTPGQPGRTLDVPPIYIFYQHIFVSGGNPNTSLGFALDLEGTSGGNGGRGGTGGPAGSGARGIAAGCSQGLLPVPPFAYCTCDRGPGIGGDAGVRGTGGRGGDAGRGGNGGSIFFVGPNGSNDAYHRIVTGFTEILQAGAQAGIAGSPGEQGSEGVPGGGGQNCTCCNGRSGGNGSPAASPSNLGPGTPAPDGQRGSQALIVRDNGDLF